MCTKRRSSAHFLTFGSVRERDRQAWSVGERGRQDGWERSGGARLGWWGTGSPDRGRGGAAGVGAASSGVLSTVRRMTDVTTPGLVLTEEFSEALARLRAGENVFLTGRAGTGKSTLIREFMNSTRRNVVVVAPTGIAALNVGGYTIHRLFSLRPGMTPEEVRSGSYYPGRFAGTLKELHTLIVDEASMVRADLFDCLAQALERFGPKPGKRFGGVQIVLVGDPYQLPPVVSDGERSYFETRYETPYFFSSDAFWTSDFMTLELTTVFRQVGDPRMVELLNAVREGVLLEEARTELNLRTDPDFVPPVDEFWLTLTTTNRMATSRNRRMLEQLMGPELEHHAVLTGELRGMDLPLEQVLTYKVGAQVMMLTNDPLDRWANGTIAKVMSQWWDDDGVAVAIELPDHSVAVVRPELWEITQPTVEDGRLRHDVVGTFTQLPFRLAWAVTIHKSQGQTLDRVVVDLTGGTFADGQLYVALSRCTSMNGLVLTRPVLPRDLKVDQRIRRFLRAAAPAGSQAHRGYAFLGICSVGEIGERWRPRPVELAVVTSDGLELSTLINPTRDMGDAAARFGVSAADVQLAPLLVDAWSALAPHLAGYVPVGVSVDHELGFLDYELKRNGYVTRMPMGLGLPTPTAAQRRELEGGRALGRARAARDMAASYELDNAAADSFPTPPSREGYLMPRPGEQVVFQVVRGASAADGAPSTLSPEATLSSEATQIAVAVDSGATDSGAADAAPQPQETARAILVEKLREAVARTSPSAAAREVLSGISEHTGMSILTSHEPIQHTVDNVLMPGTRVCFTGTVLDDQGQEITRFHLETVARKHGLDVVGNVTKTRCDALICAEDGSQSNKAKNAVKWGKPIVTAAQFLAWANGDAPPEIQDEDRKPIRVDIQDITPVI